MPFCPTRRGARARWYSSSKISHSKMPTPRPPYSGGQLTTDHRSEASLPSHTRCCSKPSAVSSEARLPGAGA